MSLGLGDLKKKSVASGKVVKSSHKTESAKPWSTSGLASNPRDAVMNDDGPTLHAAPLFFVDIKLDSRLAKLEERVVRALEGPLKAAQTIFPKFFAQ